MSAKVYDRIASLCMLVAIGSALLYEKAQGPWQVLDLGVAVASGLVAAGLYFYNQGKVGVRNQEREERGNENL